MGVQLRCGVDETFRSHEKLACHSRISVRSKNMRLTNDACPIKEYLETRRGWGIVALCGLLSKKVEFKIQL